MILTYKLYVKLYEAIAKHALAKGLKRYNDIAVAQNDIYDHYIHKYGGFAAINSHGTKELFYSSDKKERERFRKFMNPDKYEEDTYHYYYARYSSKRHKSNHRTSRKRADQTKDTSSQDSVGTSQT